MVKGFTLSVVIENSTSMEKPNLLAQHGLCFLLEVSLNGSKQITTLMDTGPTSRILLNNIDVIGIDPKSIDIIFLSHGHYDHTGGLIGILRRINRKVPIIAHPDVFEPKLKVDPYLKYIGSHFTSSEVEEAGGLLLLPKNSVKIANGFFTSGQIERMINFEKIKGFHTIKKGNFVADHLLDDQALIIQVEGKGVALITGCAHSGIINTLKQAQKITNFQRIHAVIGGFHLKNASDKNIKLTVKELQKLNPEIIAPCHCTGPKATNLLIRTFGEKCKPLRTGDVLTI